MDPAGGTAYVTLGTNQLLSVPYAISAKTSENVSGTAGNLAVYTGTNTLGNSFISEVPGSLNVIQLGTNSTPTTTAFYGPATQAYNTIFEGADARGYFGSFSGALSDVDFGTALANTTGSIHLSPQGAPKFTITNSGNVGIGLMGPSTNLEIEGDRGTAVENIMVRNTGLGTFPSVVLRINSNNTTGVALFGGSGGGLNVGDLLGVGYVPCYASAFTVSSDVRIKKEINYLGITDYDKYLTEIRNISSATYRYNWENETTAPWLI